MAQELTFNISEDRRKLQGPVEAKNFNLKFGTDGVAITHGNPKQWVQGRIGDNELKQVFVNITEGENNTPKDVAGLFLAFVGIIYDKDGRPHRVVDYKHSTTIDVEHGRFRFDFPDQAFTVAGEYQQAFFMLVKEGPGGGCVATMEFDMQVMANFVFTDLVPEDYITPFNDTVDQLLAACKKFKDDTAADEAKFKQELEDAYAKFQKDTNTQLNNFKDATDEDLANFKKANADDIAKFKQQYADAVQAKEDELQSKVDSYTDKVDTLLKDLNQQGIDTTTLLTTLQANIKSLEDQIKQDGLFTQTEAEAFENALTKRVTDLTDQYSKKFDQGFAQIGDKANYNYDAKLDNPNNILFPTFTKQSQNHYRDELYMSDNGVDLYHVNQYGSGVDFTNRPVAVDCSTMFYDGYVYQIYDYAKSPYPDQIESHFLGGNGIQIRRSKDLITWEFIDVDLPAKWLQTWAPEWYVEDDTIYVLLSLSDCSATAKNKTDNVVNWVKQTYIISTTDFKTWTDPQPINLGLDNCIDPFVIKENGSYYLFVKNEITGKIVEFKSSDLTAGYTQLSILDPYSPAVYEGPSVIEYKGGYLMTVDAPNEGLVMLYTKDIENWHDTVHAYINDGQIPKHCTPVSLRNPKLREIVKSYIKAKAGQSPFVNSERSSFKTTYLYPGQSSITLYPNTMYIAQSSVSSKIEITSYTTNLMQKGDEVSFLLASGNYSASIVLRASGTVYTPTLFLANATGANTFVKFKHVGFGIFPEAYHPNSTTMYSKKFLNISSNFTKTNGDFTAPENGYLYVLAHTTEVKAGQYIDILWKDTGSSIFTETSFKEGYPGIMVPVSAGQTYELQYNFNAVIDARFYYLQDSLNAVN